MGRGYRVAIIAVGAMFVLGGQAKPVPNQIETNASQTAAQEQWPPLPLPVQVVEEEAEKDARERAESEARQRDIDDVIAQQGMNDASQRMANAADWQTKIVFVGTMLVFATLLVTVVANRAAFKMIGVTEDTAKRQLRAYVVARSPEKEISNNEFEYTVDVVNTGQTPAHRVFCAINMIPFESVPPQKWVREEIKNIRGPLTLGAGQTIKIGHHKINVSAVRSGEKKAVFAVLWGWVEYDDIFPTSDRHRTEFSHLIIVSNGGDGGLNTGCIETDSYNGADDGCTDEPKSYKDRMSSHLFYKTETKYVL